MKDIKPRLIELLQEDYCTPKISKIAKEISEASSTIHYNINKLEEEGKIINYKAVFDHKKIDQGFCAFTLINLAPEEYGDPEEIARELAKFDRIESVDIVTGDWELILKVRAKDMDKYYNFVKSVISREGVINIQTLSSLKQVKSEFVELEGEED